MVEDSFVIFNSFSDDPKRFSIMHQNIRSLRENFNSLKIFLESVNHLPDVICLTEIWITESELSCFQINGYNQFASCNEISRAGGTAVFVSQQFHVESTAVEMISADIIKIIIDLDINISLSLFSIYRLHSNTVPVFLGELTQLLSHCKDKNLILIGDINLCILENNQNVHEYQLLMNSNGFEQLIDIPTRGRRCLDHIYLRARDGIRSVNASVISSGRSDHDIIFCNFELVSKGNLQCNNDVQVVSKIDYFLLNGFLGQTDWSRVFQQTNVSDAYDNFLYILNNVISQSSYFKRKLSGIKLLKPWITVELCQRQKYRNKLYKKMKKAPNNLRLARHFYCFSNRLKQDMKAQKENYYLQLFTKDRKNVRKQWLTIDEILGIRSKNKHLDQIYAYLEPQVLVKDAKSIAKEFNTFFISVISKIQSDINLNVQFDSDEFKQFFPTTGISESFYFVPTDANEISNTIKCLSSNKSPGIDGISAFTLKAISDHISPVLTYIFNFSFEQGEFPQSLKTAVVVPLFKKGDTTNLNNYRPISLLSCFSKILEKIVKKRILNFLNKHTVFSLNQFGFIEGKSTEDALLKFFTDIFYGLNSSSAVAGIFVDITKAFDSVDHNIMLKKLEDVGIRGLSLQWFKSYLFDRMQCVRVNGQLSSCVTVKCGVPQGSVLGPIMFLLYINDLCSGRFFGNLTCFADDTALSYSTENINDLNFFMQRDLNFLNLWFSKNKMALSTKTKLIRFRLRNRNEPKSSIYFKCDTCLPKALNEICVNCVNIEQVPSIKYLGLIVDENCTWKYHISSVRIHLYRVLRKMYYLKYVCPLSVLKSVYFALVNSKLQYGLVLWGGTYFSSIQPIVLAQKKVIRQICNVHRHEHTFLLFQRLNILPLRHFFIYRVMRIFFIRGGQIVSNSIVHSARLRSRNMVVLPQAHFEAFKRSFAYLSLSIYNKLPLNITSSVSINIFLRELKKWLFSVDSEGIEHFLWR